MWGSAPTSAPRREMSASIGDFNQAGERIDRGALPGAFANALDQAGLDQSLQNVVGGNPVVEFAVGEERRRRNDSSLEERVYRPLRVRRVCENHTWEFYTQTNLR